MPFKIQAILFPIDNYDTIKARKWLKSHHYRPIKRVHKTDNFLRYRINNPIKSTYITKKLDNGINIILQFIKKSKYFIE